MNIERDTPMRFDTAGGSQTAKAQTQTHKYKCAIMEKQRHVHANLHILCRQTSPYTQKVISLLFIEHVQALS